MTPCDRTAYCGVVPAIRELPLPHRMPFPPGNTITIITPDEDDEDEDEPERNDRPREERYPPLSRIPRIPNLH